MRKVTIRLEDDSPLFQYPPGERSRIAREWLSIGMMLTDILVRIESKLDRILSGQANIPAEPTETPEQKEDPKDDKSWLAASLLDAIEEWEKNL